MARNWRARGFAFIGPEGAAIAAAVAAVLGMVVENSSDGSYDVTIPRMEYMAYYVQTIGPAGGEPQRGLGPPIGELSQYKWAVDARPKQLLQVVTSKVYSPQGFEGQGVRLDSRRQYSESAPRLYKFEWVNTFGGGGRGGGVGG